MLFSSSLVTEALMTVTIYVNNKRKRVDIQGKGKLAAGFRKAERQFFSKKSADLSEGRMLTI